MAFYIFFIGGVYYSQTDVTEFSTSFNSITIDRIITTDDFTTTGDISSSDDSEGGEEFSTTLSTVYSLSTEIENTKKTSPDCRLPGVLYRGTKNITLTGRVCQRWAEQSPHEHNYDVISLAQENYCRNFDREEPWCFTTDPDVRWELCGVDVCATPCLNQSFYRNDVIKQCYSGNTQVAAADCELISTFGLCLKKQIEISSGVKCPEVKLRSILLQMKSKIERSLGKSISNCVKSPCTDPTYADSLRLIRYAEPCIQIFPVIDLTLDTPMDSLCRTAVGIAHCVLATVTNETDSTCLTKDKINVANNFINLIPKQFSTRINFCIKNNFTEFLSPDVENTVQDSTTNVNQTLLFLLVGFGVLLLFVAILVISLLKMRTMLLRKRRKDLMRLPSIPKTGSPQYEATFVVSDAPHLDPDYDVIEEMDEGYECLPKPKIESTTQTFSEQRNFNTEEPYIVPNNVDASYLEALHVRKNIIDYINIHPYIDIVEYAVDNTVDDQFFQSRNGENLRNLETQTASSNEKK
ncbi:uncharacterized protein LOC133186096 [Saccostrea echinata]|uniref:uncharacterized protein LOC133186096 n=1 Tax=Saccostrea echinata TaxID=191078 RepID=UPI002A7ED942|nr:uncharacterized protein LOC133186096 [Saccostrea echinata]